MEAGISGGARVGCLLAHGFGGSPEDFGDLAAMLGAEGFEVDVPHLAGDAPDGFFRTQWQQWLSSLEEGHARLGARCDRVVLLGFSLGGVLGVLLAQRLAVTGLATMGSRVIPVKSWRTRRSPVRPLLCRIEPSTRAHHQLQLAVAAAAQALPHVSVPTLVMHGRGDQVVTATNAEVIHQRVSSRHKELLWWDDTPHQLLVEGPHREAIATRLVEFCRSTSVEGMGLGTVDGAAR